MNRGVINYSCSCSPKITVIWFISAFTFYFFFQMALRNSSSHDDSNPNRPAISAPSSTSNAEQRSILYAKMAKDLNENGAVFPRQGETSQSLSLLDFFILEYGTVTPVLKAANPPVRANVLHLSPEYSIQIAGHAIKTVLGQWTWSPSYGTIDVEAGAIKTVTETKCPLNIFLDRVVLTSTGVLLGCWQVISGTDPVTILTKLKTALPRAPEKQLVKTR